MGEFMEKIKKLEKKLEAVELKKNFISGGDVLEILKNINMSFEQNRSYAITGVSGSGKSTLLQLLGGLDTPTSGTVLLDGQDIFTWRPSEKNLFFNRSIGFVFQFHYLIRELTVLENVMLMGFIKNTDKKDCLARAREVLSAVGVDHKRNNYPTELSGGELQRVAVARAVFNRPAFLLADEPTGSLDEHNAQLLVQLLLKYQQEWGMGLIISTHDKEVYSNMSTVYHLHEGVLSLVKQA